MDTGIVLLNSCDNYWVNLKDKLNNKKLHEVGKECFITRLLHEQQIDVFPMAKSFWNGKNNMRIGQHPVGNVTRDFLLSRCLFEISIKRWLDKMFHGVFSAPPDSFKEYFGTLQ